MLNWVDWIILAVVGFSSLLSLKRGFIKEAVSLCAWVAAIYIAVTFRGQMSALLVDVISLSAVRELLAFFILFVATLLVGTFVNITISQLLKVSGLKLTDRIIGVLFGAVRGLAIVLVCVILLPSLLPVTDRSSWQQSLLIPHFSIVEEWVYRVVPRFDRFQQIVDFL